MNYLLGGLLLVLGLLILGAALANRRTARLLEGPPVPISKARGGRRVHVRGRVRVADDVLAAPFSGREAVWVSARIEVERGGASSVVWKRIRSVPFFVDDDSGEAARVRPAGATVLVDEKVVAEGHEAREMMRAEGVEARGRPRVIENVLAPWDEVRVIGHGRRRTQRAADAYRDAEGPAIFTLARRRGRRKDLVLSVPGEGEAARVADPSLGCLAAIFIGAGLAFIFLLAPWLASR